MTFSKSIVQRFKPFEPWYRKFCMFAVSGFLLLAVTNGLAYGQLFPTYINGSFTLGSSGGSSPYSLSDTFLLESNPTATKTIYLDFNGHHSVNNRWGHDIVFPAFDRNNDVNTFSNSELIEIQRQFQNVAEDFLPFNVNVTTRDPGIDALKRDNVLDNNYGVRAVNTQATDGFGNGIGGVAYLNSFDDDKDNPVFTFNKGANNGALTNSHEVGHALGLRHDGNDSDGTYHRGSGSGPTGWGPIMGAPFGKNLTQWSNGDYPTATNTEDDYSIITKNANGFDFRDDVIGDTIQTAQQFLLDSNGEGFEWGIVEENTDLDFFEFDLDEGQLELDINPFQDRPNLDILANLYDSDGTLLDSSNPVDDVNASFDYNILNAGKYYVSIEGTGKTGVYSDYGSIGFFSVSASFFASAPEPGSLLLIGLAGLVGINRRRRNR